MATSFFFLQIDKNDSNANFLDKLEKYSCDNKKQIYIINKPLGDTKYNYEYQEAFLLLAPNYKLIFVQLGKNKCDFDRFVEDFIEDLGSISDKYRYKDIIGRPRIWRKDLIAEVHITEYINNIENLFDENRLLTGELKKKCELLISLLTGSINDIDKVKGDIPDNLLDKIKQKIQLFDGDQTRFVYQKTDQKRITIQGLSGTGKTELLLHKLKDIYTSSQDVKVAFTCHNKILADSLRKRIPEFFNFMKVEEQIEWNERLLCVNAWGSKYNPFSGIYRYICEKYNLNFNSYSFHTSFDSVCKKALEEIKKLGEDNYIFDYMLIDESQDFQESFFELSELVTKNTVYIAGDIFQSIFDDSIISEIQPDFLLSKCYRTDPKTLMFAHALGMGLFESPKLRWLKDNEWKACGYELKKITNGAEKYQLSREPLRRFEDLNQLNFSSIELVQTSKELDENSEKKIVEIIRDIKKENPTVIADDIGIIFMDDNNNSYLSIDKLSVSIPREFSWKVNKAYESKEKIKDTLFISNKNNVKGLEFPFVICVTKKIHNNPSYRNTLYMVLTRSFLRSYLLISKDCNEELAKILQQELKNINETSTLLITPPTEDEKEVIVTAINYDEKKVSFYDFVHNIFDDLEVMPIFRPSLFNVIKTLIGEKFDGELIIQIINKNYDFINNKK